MGRVQSTQKINQGTRQMNGLHYEWELQDSDGEWQAGGSSNSLADTEREGTRYLVQYSGDGVHTLISTEHRSQVIKEISLG